MPRPGCRACGAWARQWSQRPDAPKSVCPGFKGVGFRAVGFMLGLIGFRVEGFRVIGFRDTNIRGGRLRLDSGPPPPPRRLDSRWLVDLPSHG